MKKIKNERHKILRRQDKCVSQKTVELCNWENNNKLIQEIENIKWKSLSKSFLDDRMLRMKKIWNKEVSWRNYFL